MRFLLLFFLIAACGTPKHAIETVYKGRSPLIVKEKVIVKSMRGKYKYKVKDAGYGFDLFTHEEYNIGDTLGIHCIGKKIDQ